MYTIRQIRDDIYNRNVKVIDDMGIDLTDFRKNPYSILKFHFYIWVGALLLRVLLKTDVKPNTITQAYGLAGLMGGLLLSLPNRYSIIAGLFIFFTYSTLDWCDGTLARIRGQTSVTGHVLDPYGSLLGSLGFQMGLGFYVAGKNGAFFLYLIPLIPFCSAASLKYFSDRFLFNELVGRRYELNEKGPETIALGPATATAEEKTGVGKYRKYYNVLTQYLDERSRTVDFICLLIVLELYTPLNVTWVVFLLKVLQQLVIFCVHFYVVGRGGWVESLVRKHSSKGT